MRVKEEDVVAGCTYRLAGTGRLIELTVPAYPPKTWWARGVNKPGSNFVVDETDLEYAAEVNTLEPG